MITDKKYIGNNIILRQIELSDCSDSYVNWLNDPQVNQYLEVRWSIQNLESITDFVQAQRSNDNSVLFAIIEKLDGRHIGNIKIGPVNWHYLYADVSYFIGDKSCWNRGIATEAINLTCKFGFEELGLRKIEAGAYAEAIGSWKALERNGFVREGTFRENIILHEKIMDVYRYGILKREFINLSMEGTH